MRSLSRRSLILLAATSLSLFLLLIASSQRMDGWSAFDQAYFHRDGAKNNKPKANSTDPTRPDHDRHCENFPDTGNILLVMKTGASESYARIPTQLLTILKCVPDFLIFSDMDQEIAGYRIHDSLSTVLESAKAGNSDFDLYRRQKACIVNQEDCNKLGNPAKEGWNLDKYKNIHMAEKTYHMRPDYDWYVFVDADSYVLWPNLVMWLKQLNPMKKLYLGSVALLGGFNFGHGGSGYVVSQGAMADFVGKHPGIGNQWDIKVKSECCGDYVFARAMKEVAGTPVQQVWPTINGEKYATLPFGFSHWCHPIVTMHHLNSEEINDFWAWERDLAKPHNGSLPDSSKPLLIKDIYHRYLEPRLQESRIDWDNRANDRYYLDATDETQSWEDWQKDKTKKAEDMNELEKKAHLSFKDCAAACESLAAEECFSYRYMPGICMTAKAFTLGKPIKKDDDGNRMMSGWDVKKINKFVAEQGECTEIHWPKVNDKDNGLW
ncbi:glycoprotein-N-acetylgalactosamine 3-beta-galactosyltransferase 1 [Rhypophila decipiens]|uniref:N-acetylgalactosaminide beta-1,3-galactosyltransferase n=1 Tax=Rhypophila decipiens TaxID=261697 RepID=A0AAN6XY89_9PEZI|nr:glycoprotein-N-acetylgalactosamine 3-beta-galactosyltransferase 1 [Rhypophila decipiens]